MKRCELGRRLTTADCVLLRPGGRIELNVVTANGKKQSVPRHAEVDEHLARYLCRVLGVLE